MDQLQLVKHYTTLRITVVLNTLYLVSAVYNYSVNETIYISYGSKIMNCSLLSFLLAQWIFKCIYIQSKLFYAELDHKQTICTVRSSFCVILYKYREKTSLPI